MMAETRIRRLNDEGMRRMREFVVSLKSDSPQPYSEARGLLDSPDASDGFSQVAHVDPARRFATRYDLARYLHERIPLLRHPDPLRDAGLWSWLALLWFEQLCPFRHDGKAYPGAEATLIPEFANRRYYRHLILGPYVVYQVYQDADAAKALLNDPVSLATSEVFRLFIESSRLFPCRAVAAALTELYYDPIEGKLKRGKGRKGPGGMRRFVRVLSQFDRTYDLMAIEKKEAVLQLLPREFDRFR